MLALAGLDPVEFVEVLNLAGNLYGKVLGVKAGNKFYATLAIKNGAAKCCFSNTIGADHAHACNHRAFEHRL